ncbi:MAG: hypothetical protein IK151_04670 [Erysipelotrichaceae bacterium]|nr:hypothetical protein [Erysipelotrichaceae bacterium]
MKNYSYIDRFKYWLDKQMSKGTSTIIQLLTVAVISVVLFVTTLIVLFKLRDNLFSAFWDSLATIVNAWMPSSEDGEVGYIVLNTITAIVGLLFTSILIGVISSGIEEKLDSLRKGNSVVLERNHTVILGYNLGEHGLLNQLILATGDEKRVIVICTDIEKPDMEADLSNNVDIPKNIEVICRNGDITNINDLRCCSIENAKLLIINALNDNRRIKAILAISALKKEHPECNATIVACVSDDKHLLPKTKIDKKNIIMLKTDDIMAKMIAHTSTEPGLSIAFKELLNFEGNELYFEKIDELTGFSVLDASACLEDSTLAGIRHKGKIKLNPDSKTIIEEGDELLLFETERNAYKIIHPEIKDVWKLELNKVKDEKKGTVVIFGYNILLDTILSEVPSDVDDVIIVSKHKEEITSLKKKYRKLHISLFEGDYEKKLDELADEAEHFILLADREIDKEDADIDNILLLLKLMDIRERKDYGYNVTVELNMENSYNVAVKNNNIDYIVSSNVASLILAQMAENPDFEEVLSELLSKKGNELYSKTVKMFNLEDNRDYSYGGLKQILLSYDYTLLGYVHNGEIEMNPKLDTRIQIDDDDRLIVLGKN